MLSKALRFPSSQHLLEARVESVSAGFASVLPYRLGGHTESPWGVTLIECHNACGLTSSDIGKRCLVIIPDNSPRPWVVARA